MKNILVIIFTATAFCSFSQERMVIVKQNDGQRTSKALKTKEERIVDHTNAIKFDPLRMTIGEINFAWETKIKDRLTFETELGPTLSNVRFLRNGNHFFSGPSGDQVKSGLGVMLSGALRYYPLDDYMSFNRLYLSPKLKYRRFNETIQSSIAGLEDQKGFTNEFMFQFNVGIQQWISSTLAFDYYIGLGLGSYNNVSYYSVNDYDPVTNQTFGRWEKATNPAAQFSFTIGLKVAIGY